MSPSGDATGLELACLKVGSRCYGIDVHQVREIVRGQEVTPLPRAPRLVEGVIDLRGTIVPVVDLGRTLLDEPVGEGPSTRIAIVEAEGHVFGLRVEAAVEVLAATAAEVRPPPPLVARTGYEVVRAVVRRPQVAPVLVLSLEHLLARVHRSNVSAGRVPTEGPDDDGSERGESPAGEATRAGRAAG